MFSPVRAENGDSPRTLNSEQYSATVIDAAAPVDGDGTEAKAVRPLLHGIRQALLNNVNRNKLGLT